MTTYYLKMTLLSDATFGRGDGIAGLVDVEVEHDEYGLPYLRGRTLKGLWREECENLIAVRFQDGAMWQQTCNDLFGRGGSDLASTGLLHVGDARVPDAVRQAVHQAQLPAHDVLTSLTTIRRQTAIDDKNGIAQAHSLRSMRAILRGTTFISAITTTRELLPDQEAVLMAGCYALRRVGTGRNRGRGEVRCRLHDAHGVELAATRVASFTGVTA